MLSNTLEYNKSRITTIQNDIKNVYSFHFSVITKYMQFNNLKIYYQIRV